MKRVIMLLVGTMLVVVSAGLSCAEMSTFSDSNELGAWAGDPAGGYGWVDTTADATALHFTVTANTDYFGSTNLVWDKFLFNYEGTISKDDVIIDQTMPGTWEINQTQSGPYGTFEFILAGTAIGSNAVNPLLFSIEGLGVGDLVANADGWMFAGHLRGFEISGISETSTWLGAKAPVPEPATMLLFGTGLAGLAAFRRKKS